MFFFLETRVNFCRSWVIRILGLCWGIYQLRSRDYIVKSTILNFWMFCIVSHFCHSATTSNFRGFLDWIVRLIIALYPVSCINYNTLHSLHVYSTNTNTKIQIQKGKTQLSQFSSTGKRFSHEEGWGRLLFSRLSLMAWFSFEFLAERADQTPFQTSRW